jgi:hypothetical protein
LLLPRTASPLVGMNRLLRRNANRNDDDDTDPDYWRHTLREWRHNPCLMRPLTACVLLVIVLFGLITTLLKFPTFLLSILLGGVLQKFNWVIEFLYPTSLGKWIHLTIAEYVSKSRMVPKGRWSTDKNRGYHSRTAEQRIEVVPSRVYIHPLPQFMDNLGYLIVCVPSSDVASPSPSSSTYEKETKMPDRDEINGGAASPSGGSALVGILVDCGQASAIESQLELIRNLHYPA